MSKKQWVKIGVLALALGFAPAYDGAGQVSAAAVNAENDAAMAAAYYEEGQIMLQRRDFERAMESFDQALKLDNTNADIFAARANLYYIIGNQQIRRALQQGKLTDSMRGPFVQSMRDYTSAIQLENDNVSFYQARGIVFRVLGEYDKALSDFNKVIQAQPNNFSIYDRRAECYADMADYPKALADLDKALKINPKDRLNAYFRGVIFARQGKYNEALEKFDEASKISKWFAEPWLMKGIIYEQLGKTNDAIYAYGEFIARDKVQSRATSAFVNERLEVLSKAK